MIFFILFIILIHVILLIATYHNLNRLETKEKWMFIGIGIGALYLLSTILFGITDIGIDYGNVEAKEMINNLLTFTVTPINGVILLPFLANSYSQYKSGSIGEDAWKKRVIRVTIVLLIAFLLECMYMKNVKLNVLEIVQRLKESTGK